MALVAAGGHRVVLVTATRGEEGLVPDDLLDPGEDLGARRTSELSTAAGILGVHRVEFLGYRDSGMMGWAQNEHPDAFWNADVEDAARRLAAIVSSEDADVLTVYDEHGGYGHPDHIQVHRVGHRAAVLAGTGRVYEATMSRERIRELRRSLWTGSRDDLDDASVDAIGMSERDISTVVDVGEVLDVKRAAMAAHASQLAPDSWFLRRDDPVVDAALGSEFFRRVRPELPESFPQGGEHSIV